MACREPPSPASADPDDEVQAARRERIAHLMAVAAIRAVQARLSAAEVEPMSANAPPPLRKAA